MLQAFHHRSICSILGITMFQVQERRITNEQILKQFHDIPDIVTLTKRRQLQYLGKVVRKPMSHLPPQLLSCHIQRPRERGRPQTTTWKTYIDLLREVFPTLPPDGRFKLWAHHSQDQHHWKKIVNTLGSPQQHDIPRNPEPPHST